MPVCTYCDKQIYGNSIQCDLLNNNIKYFHHGCFINRSVINNSCIECGVDCYSTIDLFFSFASGIIISATILLFCQ